jgi:hypothetical protein
VKNTLVERREEKTPEGQVKKSPVEGRAEKTPEGQVKKTPVEGLVKKTPVQSRVTKTDPSSRQSFFNYIRYRESNGREN